MMAGIRAFSLLLLCIAGPVMGRDATTSPRALNLMSQDLATRDLATRDLASKDLAPLDLMDLGAPSFTNFSARDGLPDAVTVSIRADRNGFVWAATPLGVYRYDGRSWVASDDPAMAHSVDSLWVDRQGTLWAAFRSDGLAHYDGRRWHVENTSTGLPSQQIRRFTETVDRNGAATLWALTWDQGLMYRRGSHWRADPGNPTLPHGAILSMAQTVRLGGHRRDWVGTGSAGLWYRDEGARDWQQWHDPGIDSTQVEYLLATERNGKEELWISVFGVGLWRLSDGGLARWSKEDGSLPTDELYDMASTPLTGGDRAIWVSSRSGLLRIHDDHVQVFDKRNGLTSSVIRGLNAWHSPSGNEVVWLATEAGISRTVLGASAWTTASLMGARSIGVFGVLVEPDDNGGERVWVGASDDGLGLYSHGRWQRFTHDNGALPASSVSMVVATTGLDGARTRWIGLRGGALARVRIHGNGKPTFEWQDTPWPKNTGEAPLDTLVRIHDGREEQWVATRQSGIYRLRDGKWTAFRAKAVSGQWGVGKLQQQVDAGGRAWLWASTNQGLARFDGKRWDLLGKAAGLPDPNLIGLSLLEDTNARPILWMGSASAGTTRIDVSDPLHPVVMPDTLPSFTDPTSYGALRDTAGRIYICTNNGVQQLTPDHGTYLARVFSRQDGMVNDECNTNAQFIDAHDRFWTGTLGGLAVYDPRGATPDRQPKPLHVTDMRVDGKAVAPGLAEDASTIPPIQVVAGAKAVQVDFALLSWYRENASRFRTQLLGYEDAPSDWTTQASRNFNSLPPGNYTLRVEARDHAGNASPPIEVPITVQAQWWQRPWAFAAAVLALLLLGHAGSQWRTRRLQVQRRVLEDRVAERTAELDMANSRLLELSYHDALTGLSNRRKLLERLDDAPGSLAANSSMTGNTALIFVDVDHFKNYNDNFGHPAGDEALRGVADVMLQCAPDDALVARYGGEEFACLLPNTTTAQAAALAERMRTTVADREVPVPGETRTMRVTISAGVASAPLMAADDAHRLLRDADMALYQAKEDGRNCVRERAADRTIEGVNGSR